MTSPCIVLCAVCSCGLPEVFHLDGDRSRVDLRRAGTGGAIMPAIDRKCFDCKQTTPSTGSASVVKLHS